MQGRNWRGQKGAAPLKQKFLPPNCPACLPKLPFALRQFQGDIFFFGNQQRTRRKVDQFGAMTFFFEISGK